MHTSRVFTEITADATLNEIVASYPHLLQVLQQVGLDTCCGGSLQLSTAAEHHNLDLTQLLATLQAMAREASQ